METYRSAGALLGLPHEAQEEATVVAVVGCGGKTTLIESLADEFRHRKVLVTPTTKIWPMRSDRATVCATLQDCLAHEPAVGIQCFGQLREATGKLEALPTEILEKMAPRYDLVLLEADGSQGLPCKGWLPTEPVVPDFCTHTVGVVTMLALGKPADTDWVLRLPAFLALTGLRRGQAITRQALTAMVCGAGGMFRNGRGRLCLLVNRVCEASAASSAPAESAASAAQAAHAEPEAPAVSSADAGSAAQAAQGWLQAIRRACPGQFSCLAWGSARANQWKEV